MPDCKRCSDGSIVCGNPPHCGRGDSQLFAASAGAAAAGERRGIEQIVITIRNGAFEIESTPPGFDFGKPKRIIVTYRNPKSPSDRNVQVKFTS